MAKRYQYRMTMTRKSGITSIQDLGVIPDKEAEKYARTMFDIDHVTKVVLDRREVKPWRTRVRYNINKGQL